MLLGRLNQGERDGLGMWHLWGEDTHIQDTRWKNLKVEEDLEDIGINGSVILKRILPKVDGRASTVLIWFMIRTRDWGCCEDGHERSGPINFWEFLDTVWRC